MDEQTRAVLTEIIRAVESAKGVNKAALRRAWDRLYPPAPPPPLPQHPFMPEALTGEDHGLSVTERGFP